jgi:hypothetical protein
VTVTAVEAETTIVVATTLAVALVAIVLMYWDNPLIVVVLVA